MIRIKHFPFVRAASAVICIAVGVAIPSLADNATRDQGVAIAVTGPLVIGFFPPTTQTEMDDADSGFSEAIAHVCFALEDINKCLAALRPTIRLELTRSITLQGAKKSFTIPLATDWQHSIGVILASPDKKPQIVYAEAGPSTLLYLGPDAAAEYFRVPACRVTKLGDRGIA
jgi:hypothetical protein